MFLNKDSNTIIIDATLTKKGKQILATGVQNFIITKFAVADDEVNYNLWDPSASGGTDSYGLLIQNIPVLQPVTDGEVFMKYKLVSLPKDTIIIYNIDMPGFVQQSFSYFRGSKGSQLTLQPSTTPTSFAQGYSILIQGIQTNNLTQVFAQFLDGTSKIIYSNLQKDTDKIMVNNAKRIILRKGQFEGTNNINISVTGQSTGATASYIIQMVGQSGLQTDQI